MGNKPDIAYAMVGGMDADSLIARHMGMVRKIAWHTVSRFGGLFDVADLVQIGMIALIEAARKFEDRGVPFASYATMRIRGAMVDAYRDSATSTRSAMAKQRLLRDHQRQLGNALGREPSAAELATAMGISERALHDIIGERERSQTVSINDYYTDESSLFADDGENPEQYATKENIRRLVATEIAKCSQREQQILQMFFFEEMNLDEIGCALNITAARVCQIKKAAMEKLRANFGDCFAELL